MNDLKVGDCVVINPAAPDMASEPFNRDRDDGVEFRIVSLSEIHVSIQALDMDATHKQYGTRGLWECVLVGHISKAALTSAADIEALYD